MPFIAITTPDKAGEANLMPVRRHCPAGSRRAGRCKRSSEKPACRVACIYAAISKILNVSPILTDSFLLRCRLLSFNHSSKQQVIRKVPEACNSQNIGEETIMDANINIDAMQASDNAEVAAAKPVAIDVDKLYREHRQHLLRFVQRYMRNSEDAEDVVQNTFIEAMRCADRFSGLSKPSTWLFGIALNLARNQIRRNCNDIYEEVDEAFINEIADANSDPAMLIELRQIAEKVDAMLNELPFKIRATFEAVLDGESTYEEAAEHLQVPIGTVRSRVSRVRAAVRAECLA
jgi:RNA polymerase sigma-70 factor (ECF subfamily)